MTTPDTIREIPLEDLIIGKGQVRVRDVGKEIDELAASIKRIGLLEPIVVCPSDTPGKYEILTGQRRFLAHQLLGKKAIRATIREKADERTAKAISVTENLVRRDPHVADLIDACTDLYKKYGSIKQVAEEFGLPQQKVSEFVKYDRLAKELKDLVDNQGIDVKVALRAQDAASAGGEIDPAEAIKFAKEMSHMSGAQQKKIVQTRREDPERNVDDVIEGAKTGEKITSVQVVLGTHEHRSLVEYATQEGTNLSDAAATLITEGLSTKGYLKEG